MAASGGIQYLHTAGIQERTDNHDSRAPADTEEVTTVPSCHPKYGITVFFLV